MHIFCVIVMVAAASYLAQAQHQPVNIPSHRQGTFVSGLDPHKDISQYIHHVWQIEQGLPQSSAEVLCQTRDGYLWIGTQEGLVRFDGVRFVVFDKSNTPAMQSNSIAALMESSDGSLWIGTKGGGICRFHDGNVTNYTTKNGLSNDVILSLLQDRNGTIWIGTNGGGLNSYKNGKFTTYSTSDGLTSDVIFTLLQDREGVIWIGTTGGGLNSYSNGKFTNYSKLNVYLNDNIRSLIQDCEGTLWIGTRGGLHRYQNGIFTALTTKDGLLNNNVNSLLQDSDGAIWIGTYGGGLNRYYKGTITAFTTKNGLSNDFILWLLQDREGALWIGTWGGGLNRLRNGTFTTFTSKNGLSNDNISSVLETRDSTLWVGTWDGVNTLKNGSFKVYRANHGLTHNSINSLLEDRTGALWIGTYGGGMSRYKNGIFTSFSTKNGLSNDYVYTLLQDSNNSLWIGTWGGGLNCLQDGIFKQYTTKNGLSHNNVNSLLQDKDGSLWIGTYGGGVNHYKDGSFSSFTTKNGLSNDVVYSLFQDRDGILWIGTRGGLHRYKDGVFKTFTTKDGLFNDVAYCIVEDDDGYFWMTCNKGVYRIRRGDLNTYADGKLGHIPCQVFGKADGMLNADCYGGVQPTGWKAHDGRLWFPTIAGLLVVDPKKLLSNFLAPPVLIEEIKADSSIVDLRTYGMLAAGVEKFEFRYTATSLCVPDRVKFKYLLEGYDKEWVFVDTRRVAYYTSLPRGRQYRFRVIACNNDGVWNEVGAAAMFYIEPYFWETWWFYGLCAVSVVSSGFGAYRLRVRHLKAHAKELEYAVAERTTALKEANESLQIANTEITRQVEIQAEQAREIEITNTELHETNVKLEQTNLELADANRFKTQMLSIAAHDLKNPLSLIINFTELAVMELTPDSSVVSLINRVQNSADKMLRLVKDLLESAAIELGGIEISSAPFSLTFLLVSVVESYQSPAWEKEQTISVESDTEIIVHGDEDRLRQVFDNLISNAVKYSHNGKTILVRMRFQNNIARVEIQDEGPGISEEDKSKMFGFFQRLSAIPTGGESSNGVGLAIAKKIVDLHSGKIWAESELGHGTTFIVELPNASLGNVFLEN